MYDDPDPLITEIVAELRRTPLPDGTAARERILAAVRRERPGRVRSAWQWMRTPRTLRVSPAGALAVLAAAAIVIVVARTAVPRGSGPAVTASAAAPQPNGVAEASAVVQFVLVAPHAARVSVVGDFNGWDASATPLHERERAGGVWTAEVPLSAGRHEYAFVVDGGTWTPDPSAPRSADDDFGAPNSVVIVGEHST